MSVTTKTVWGAGFTEAHDAQWAILKADFLSNAVANGKTDGNGEKIDGVTWGGTRVWEDQTSADAWKALVESASQKLGIDATVTFE
jgi:hypothetical protein